MRQFFLPLALSLGFATTALAQATLVVRVQGAGGPSGEGTVTLTTGGQPVRTFTCQTSNGSCTLSGVPGGMHSVVFAPTGGSAGAARSVMVPPSGTVTLIVNAPR